MRLHIGSEVDPDDLIADLARPSTACKVAKPNRRFWIVLPVYYFETPKHRRRRRSIYCSKDRRLAAASKT